MTSPSDLERRIRELERRDADKQRVILQLESLAARLEQMLLMVSQAPYPQ